MDDFVARLHELLHYDPETGIFTWASGAQPHIVGKQAGSKTFRQGYVAITVDRRKLLAHRLAMGMALGKMPVHQVDHINGIKTDNRLANLREATNAENHRNTGVRCTNKSGVKNVYWHKQARKWTVAIRALGKQHFVGQFSDIADAEKAAIAFREAMHGQFVNHGIKGGQHAQGNQ